MNIEYLKSILNYNPETGIWVWLVNKRNYNDIGQQAGSINKHGYRYIKINGKNYRSSRLVWFYMKGEFPSRGLEVDHKDRDRSNDRWINLRLGTHSNNQGNKSIQCDNKVWYKGVQYIERLKKYRAMIKSKHIGLYKSAEEASLAYQSAALVAYGEFATLGVK